MKLEAEARQVLADLTSQARDSSSKEDVRQQMARMRLEQILINRKNFRAVQGRAIELMSRVDYEKVRPRLIVASPADIVVWRFIRSVVSSAPFSGRYGRGWQMFCIDENTRGILGVVEICSELTVLGPRERYIGWTQHARFKQRRLNNVANMGTCVSVQPFGLLTGGKFMASASASADVVQMWLTRYGDPLAAVTTTSLYGKSSVYERLREWDYAGETPGVGVFHLYGDRLHTLREFLRENGFRTRTGGIAEPPETRWSVLQAACSRLNVPFESVGSRQPRGVYIALGSEDSRPFLQGTTETFTPTKEDQTAKQAYWLERWYAMRLPKVRDEIKAFDWKTYMLDAQIERARMMMSASAELDGSRVPPEKDRANRSTRSESAAS